MKFFALFCLVSYATAKGIPEGEDDLASLNLDDFEDLFHLDHVTDPEEKRRREEALKENEKKVKETNEAYENGEGSWWDEINEMADLPEDEFEVTQRYSLFARLLCSTFLFRLSTLVLLMTMTGCMPGA